LTGSLILIAVYDPWAKRRRLCQRGGTFSNDRRSKVIARRIISIVLTGTMVIGTSFQIGNSTAMAQTAANANDQAMDKLMGPIALYPDPLLAQVLACASSPQQVTDVDAWLKMQDKELKGSQLQEAATAKGFDASFAAIVLFPDVLDTLAKNIPWTTEVGKAFVSDQKAVLASVQRLRKQAQMVGNLKTSPQQEVKVETQDGVQTIVIQPANPQVVYVPVYNTQTVYTTPPPPPEKEKDDSDAAALALLGFMAGVAIGAAASDPCCYPYGWGAWGVGWHSHTVVVTGGAWGIPPGGRYGYARPVPYGSYRAPTNINAPSRNINNVNVNIDRSNNINTGNNRNNTNTGNNRNNSATARPSTQPANRATTGQQPAAARPSTQPADRATTGQQPAAARPSTQPADRPSAGQQPAAARPSTQPADRPSAGQQPAAARPSTQPSTAQNRPSASTTPSTKGYSNPSASPSARTGTGSSGLSGYQNRSAAGAASARGSRSVGGGRRR
jgi:hypothetical protein